MKHTLSTVAAVLALALAFALAVVFDVGVDFIAPYVAAAFVLFALRAGVAPRSSLAATVIGAVTEETTPTTHKVRDVSDRLTDRKPSKWPLWRFAAKVLKGPPARAEKIEWENDDPIVRSSKTNGATGAGAAGAAVSIVVDDAIFVPDDVLLVKGNVDDAILQVMTANGTALSVVRVDGGTDTTWGTVPALADDVGLLRIGNAKKEFFDVSQARTTMPAGDYNFVQARDTLIEISNRRAATRNYTKDDFERSKEKQIEDFMDSEEFTLWWGKRAKRVVSGVNKTFMGGVLEYLSTNELTYSAATLNEKTLIDWARQMFTGNRGSNRRFLYASSMLMADLMAIGLDKVRRTQVESKVLQIGLNELDLGFGKLVLVHEEAFDMAGKMRFGAILDHENIRQRELRPKKTTLLKYDETTGKDGRGLSIRIEDTLEVRDERTHGIITGTA